jgi:GWxTD domain-containing protein
VAKSTFQSAGLLLRHFSIVLVTGFALIGTLAGIQQRQEEDTDYFKKWLDEDVVYIVTQEERDVFEGLTTPQEKERFIEQFWKRRDSDLQTTINEFREEHYRRIAYANERFHSGIPGWKTDRGRIYIMHGPPSEISGKPAGGTYVRPPWEGGGTTSVYPFEIWRYRYIEGIGPDIEIEFVDPHQSGEFRLARDPQEKDAALYIPESRLDTWPIKAFCPGAVTMSIAPRISRLKNCCCKRDWRNQH